MDPRDAMAPPSAGGWWQRNWKWVVPAGVIGALIVLVGSAAAIFLFVFGIIRSSEVYDTALARARADSTVVRLLGEPIEPGWWVSGSIQVSGPSGSADFEAPLHGPVGRGTLYVSAEKEAGRWRYKVLEVGVEGRDDRIDLPREGP